METIRTEIIVRFAGRARRYLFSGARIAFGSGQGCSWRVQQPWLADEHVVLENAGQCARVRIGHPGAVAMVEGNRLTPQWTLIASEGTIHIPATQGRTLEIEFSCDQRRCDVLNHERLVSSPEDAGELGVQFVSTDAVADESRGGVVQRRGWPGIARKQGRMQQG